MNSDYLVNDGASIDKKFQVRFLTQFSFSVLLGTIVSAFIFYYFTDRYLGNDYYLALLNLVTLKDNILPAGIYSGLIAAFLMSTIAIFITLLASHKIAGPVFRLERSLESIGKGDINFKIKFRKYDAVNGFEDDMNSIVDALNSDISQISESLSSIKKEAEFLKWIHAEKLMISEIKFIR